MIKTILSDLGNVVVIVEGRRAGLEIDHYNFFKRQRIISKIKKYETGKLSTEEFYTWFTKITGQNIDVKNIGSTLEGVFYINEPMIPLLKKLKNKGYRLVILSNTNEANYGFVMKKYGEVFNLFDANVLSFEVGYMKPNKNIYKTAVEKALCNPKECLFIDDNGDYIKAARKQGITAIQYNYKNHSALEQKLKEFRII